MPVYNTEILTLCIFMFRIHNDRAYLLALDVRSYRDVSSPDKGQSFNQVTRLGRDIKGPGHGG